MKNRESQTEDNPREPLLWEQKAAIVFLGLLALQEIHEGILYCLGEPRAGFRDTSLAFAILVLFYSAVGCGLALQRRSAWWSGVIVISMIALVHASTAWPAIWESMRFEGRVRSAGSHAWYQIDRNLKVFEILWLSIRSVLLIAVPALLLLGVVRTSLRPKREQDPG